MEFNCNELANVRENIRGTQGIPADGSGSVSADETFCTRNPDLKVTLAGQGASYYGWATFHNVPSAGEVSLHVAA